jgi:hypothetical protein
MADALPPLPVPGPDNLEFWEGCRRHELRIQRCRKCRAHRFYPRPACPDCGALEHEWITCTGRATVYTWTVVHPPTLPAFAAIAPYAAGIVQLDEGVFMVGQIRGVAPAAIRAGLPLTVEFDDVTDDVTLPHWRAA